MTLRIMLLGLVASMGIELPSGADVSSWTCSGRDWVNAMVVDLSGSCDSADRADARPTDCQQARETTGSPVVAIADVSGSAADAAFEAVSEAMAADFSADLLTIEAEDATIEAIPAILAVEATPAVGLPEGEEAICLVALADEAEAIDPADATTEADEAPSRLDRVSSAVRLTREAVQAWATVIQESTEEDDCIR